jgi:hypothetical protein
MSDRHDETHDDADEADVRELSDDELDSVAGGKEAAMMPPDAGS